MIPQLSRTKRMGIHSATWREQMTGPCPLTFVQLVEHLQMIPETTPRAPRRPSSSTHKRSPRGLARGNGKGRKRRGSRRHLPLAKTTKTRSRPVRSVIQKNAMQAHTPIRRRSQALRLRRRETQLIVHSYHSLERPRAPTPSALDQRSFVASREHKFACH